MDDTIVAVATPMGESAIGVVRLSGESAIELLSGVFRGELPESHTIRHGRIVDPDNGEVLDEAMAAVFRAPHTYTGEDNVEIYGHGNPFILNEIVALFVRLGARQALPGEFTQRAYLNGKMDLTRAEAVEALVQAHGKLARAQAISHLAGKFSEAVETIHASILDLLAVVEVAIDHSDLNLELESYDTIEERIQSAVKSIESLLSTSKQGRMLQSGMQVAIVGAPNTGKSSLMNLLLQEERVIVSETEGTTRDTVEDEMIVKGIPVRLVDTAGVRQTLDKVEKLGVERTAKAVAKADLVIALFDASRRPNEKDDAVMKLLANKPAVYFLNKSDLKALTGPETIRKRFNVHAKPLSTVTGEGVEEIENAVSEHYYSFGYDPETDVMVINSRQETLLGEARSALKDAQSAVDQDMSEEFVAIEIRKARNFIEEIVGKTTDDAVLDRIFAKFCIGK